MRRSSHAHEVQKMEKEREEKRTRCRRSGLLARVFFRKGGSVWILYLGQLSRQGRLLHVHKPGFKRRRVSLYVNVLLRALVCTCVWVYECVLQGPF
jgi:hypothetical protein